MTVKNIYIFSVVHTHHNISIILMFWGVIRTETSFATKLTGTAKFSPATLKWHLKTHLLSNAFNVWLCNVLLFSYQFAIGTLQIVVMTLTADNNNNATATTTTTSTITTVLRPFFRDHPGEPVPEENFWTLWCKGRLTHRPSGWAPLNPN